MLMVFLVSLVFTSWEHVHTGSHGLICPGSLLTGIMVPCYFSFLPFLSKLADGFSRLHCLHQLTEHLTQVQRWGEILHADGFSR